MGQRWLSHSIKNVGARRCLALGGAPLRPYIFISLLRRCDAQSAGEEDHRDQHHAHDHQAGRAKFIADAGLRQGGGGGDDGQLGNRVH